MQSEFSENLKKEDSCCVKHTTELLNVYCVDCDLVVCCQCVPATHGSHQCIVSVKMTGVFGSRIEEEINSLNSYFSDENKWIDNYIEEIHEDVERAEERINERVYHLKNLIDTHHQLLREELDSLKRIKIKEAKNRKEELEKRQDSTSKCLSQWKEIESKSSTDHICRNYHELHERLDALQHETETKSDELLQHKTLHICFEELRLEGLIERYNIVGELKEQLDTRTNHLPSQVVVTADGFNAITGWTVLGRQFFFTREESSRIEIYDFITFKFVGQWKLEELVNPAYLTSCTKNNCLYVINIRDDSESVDVFQVESDGSLISSWSPGEDGVCCLSVTNEFNVVLPVYMKNKLNEYSPNGRLIREIFLSSDPLKPIGHPIHVIQLTSGDFGVSFGDLDDDCYSDDDDDDDDDESVELSVLPTDSLSDDNDHEFNDSSTIQSVETFDYSSNRLNESSSDEGSGTGKRHTPDSGNSDSIVKTPIEHKISIVNSDGVTLKSFGQRKGSGTSQLNLPSSLAVRSDGCIVVADNRNDRVLLLNPDLEFKTELISKSQGLHGPRGILLHESTNRIFVMSKRWTGNKGKRGKVQFSRV